MRKVKDERINKFIGISFAVGACNLKCSYCYTENHGKVKEIPYSLVDIERAFRRKRIGGTAFINICADGEPLIHPMMVDIVKFFLQDGHYVMVLTNGTLTEKIKSILDFPSDILERLFFKISFHYEELLRLNLLDRQFANIRMIKDSPCSFTVEYITSDETVQNIEVLKERCHEEMGAYPQINIPRDERKFNLGVYSKYSLDNYEKVWDNFDLDSEFFKYRMQVFGKKYKGYCYTGYRQIWVDMADGSYRQCYHTPKIKDFMKWWKPIKWIPVGKMCPESHCYVMHSHMSLGIVPYEDYMNYFPIYADIRNRVCSDGSEWIKPTYKKAFSQGVKQDSLTLMQKRFFEIKNKILHWNERGYSLGVYTAGNKHSCESIYEKIEMIGAIARLQEVMA